MDERFHPAQQALAAGDVEGLASLLAADPALATARSKRSHPTLLQCLVLTMPPVENLETLIDLLVAHGAELSGPLIAASGVDNLRACRKLLDQGAQVDGDGEERWSPLEEALYWGHEAASSLLLERGATAGNLRTFAALGDMEAIAHCFDEAGSLKPAAGEVAWPFGTEIPEAVRRDPRQIIGNALVYAAAWGRVEAVQFLLDHGAGVNVIPAGFDFAGTPLHYAALNGRGEMVDHLLAHGADPALGDKKIGKLPEDWADHGGHGDLAAVLSAPGFREFESSSRDPRLILSPRATGSAPPCSDDVRLRRAAATRFSGCRRAPRSRRTTSSRRAWWAGRGRRRDRDAGTPP